MSGQLSSTIIELDRHTREQVENLVHATGKPEKVVMREIVVNGLKTYQAPPVNAAKMLLELADYAEKNRATGPKDLSQNLDTYLWNE